MALGSTLFVWVAFDKEQEVVSEIGVFPEGSEATNEGGETMN